MKEFMVEIDLPKQWTDEFLEMVPEQRDHLEELLKEGDIEFYSLAMNRSKLWLLMRGESQADVVQKISEFPMARFFKVDVSDIMFTRMSSHIQASFSLN